jgi:CubicO group peptidase (beta-lactamase class C family)
MSDLKIASLPGTPPAIRNDRVMTSVSNKENIMNIVSPEQVGFSASRLERIRPAMQSFIDQGKLPGIVTMIARRGQVVHAECFGWRDIEAKKPVQLDTLFPIFSMTKPVTATAMMILYEEGRFQLSDPLSKFIPEFKNVKVAFNTADGGITLTAAERQVTIHDLLTQTSGLVCDAWLNAPLAKLVEEVGLYRPEISLQEATRRLAQLPLTHQPGKKWRYGESPEVLGTLVEVLSGMSLDAFVQKRILEPLGMVDTSYGIREEHRQRLAKLYGYAEKGGFIEKVEPAPRLIPSSIPRGGWGLISTASDYMRFAQMLLNKGELEGTRILGRKTVEYMTRNHLPRELIPVEVFPGLTLPGYGYGFLVGVLLDAVQAGVLGSEGEYYWGGLSTIFWIDPKEELIAMLLTRTEFPNHFDCYYALRTFVYQAIVD